MCTPLRLLNPHHLPEDYYRKTRPKTIPAV